MDLTSLKTIKEILAEYDKRPSRGLGQNFLTDKAVLKKIIQAANLQKDDTVLEIGPGIGVLTKELAEKSDIVISIEKDEIMTEILKKTLAGFNNVEIKNADILSYEPQTAKYKIVANLPYYITSPVIRMFLEAKNPPIEMVLMVQKEVAQRICSKPPQMSLLSASVQFYAEPKIVSYVSKNCFWPIPKVDSAIIKIVPFANLNRTPDSIQSFFKLMKAGFSHPRKQLANNLAKALRLNRAIVEAWLTKNNVSPFCRAQTLTVENWINLANSKM